MMISLTSTSPTMMKTTSRKGKEYMAESTTEKIERWRSVNRSIIFGLWETVLSQNRQMQRNYKKEPTIEPTSNS